MIHAARLQALLTYPPVEAGARRAAAPTLALASALLAWAAAPPLDGWPLAFVCWAPLLVALHGKTPRSAFWIGAFQGLVFNVCLGSWLFRTIRVFGGYSNVTCAALMILVCAYHGARTGLCAWLHARAARRGWPAGIAFGLALAASEVAYPVLFPWYAGASLHSAPLLVQLAEIGGPILVSFALAGANVVLAEIGWARLERRAPSRRRLGLAALGPIAMLGYGIVRVPAVDAAAADAPAIRVGVVQANMPHVGKSIRAALTVHRSESAALEANGGVDLLVWSETALPAAISEDRLREHAHAAVFGDGGEPAFRTAVLTGAIVRREASGGAPAQERNAAVLVEPGGALGGAAYKNVLLPFGEYIPFGDRFPELHAWLPNAGRLAAGATSEPVVFRGHRITTLICYEDVIPSFVNRAVAEGDPELLVTLSNDVWFGRSAEPALHLALAKLRAVEHRRYLVRATNSGPSSFVDPVGRSVDETPLLERAARVGRVRLLRGGTPYEVIGDAPWWTAAIVVLAMGFVERPVRSSSREQRRALRASRTRGG
jgi:apolipoprotein N-acyltransferase